ncbi:MAG: hypothetical protein ACLGH4_04160 [Actinomycetes bacterium]
MLTLALAAVLVGTSASASYALWSAQVEATLRVTTTSPVPAPAELHCTEVRHNDVSLAWSPVPGVTEYVVLRRTGSDSAFTYSHPRRTDGTSLVREHRSTWGASSPGGSVVLVVRAVGVTESADSAPVTVSFGRGGSCNPPVSP